MARISHKVVPTLILTVDTESRQLSVRVQNWEGVTPGMMYGMELAIEKAIHTWRLVHTQDRRVEDIAADLLLKQEAGDGRIPADQTDAV